jgi:orotidine 5''-phosphate decarboxylase, subfamily 2
MVIDRLYESVKKNGNVCLGLDTSCDYIPEYFRNKFTTTGEALFEFNKRIIDATADVAACFKVQIAYYEAYGIDGLVAYKRTLEYARAAGSPVIADIKRGDIAQTASMYAKAHFEGDFESDFITLSPYMGIDSIEPYLKYVKNSNKGLFVLIRTSNKGAEDIQYVDSRDGGKVYEIVGDKLYSLSKSYMGTCGYSSIGGVIGCTHLEEGAMLREKYKDMFFLIPGYGAQGGGASDAAVYLKNGNGGVVNSSRGILLAYKNVENGEKVFDLCARDEVLKMRRNINDAAGIQ